MNDSRSTWHGIAGDIGVDVLQESWRIVEADAPQQLAGERAGHVDRAERQRAVEDVHVEIPRLDPVADPRLGERGAAGGEGQHEPIDCRRRSLRDRPCRRRSGGRAR